MRACQLHTSSDRLYLPELGNVEFKLYLITEFERLKQNESYQNKIEWSVRRELAKTNYRIHTDSIKEKTKFSKTICKIPKICYNKQSKLISRWQNSKGFARGKSGLQRAMMLDNV